MIGKTIICFFKRNILYFLGQNQYFFQHLPQKRMCVYVQRLGGEWVTATIRVHQVDRAAPRPLPRKSEGEGWVWVMCGHGFPVTTDNPPPSSRLNLLQDFCILQT